MKHLKNILLIICLLFLLNCQNNKIVKTHGVAFLEKKQEILKINHSNQNDARKTLGNPSTEGLFEETLWIYIERTHTKGKLTKLGQKVLLKNNVLVLTFNSRGVLTKKKFYNMDEMNKVNFSSDETVSEAKSNDFIYNFLSSIRQKMYTGRKKN